MRPHAPSHHDEKASSTKTLRRRLAAAVVAVANSLTLYVIYVNVVSPEYSYFGYSLNDVDPLGFFIALCIAAACAALLPVNLRKPSETILWIIFVVAGIPSIVVPHFAGPISDQQALSLSLQSGFAFLLLTTVVQWKLTSKAKLSIGIEPGMFWLGLTVWSLVVYAMIISAFGLPTSAPSLDDVYGVRGEYKAALTGSAALGYLIPAQAGVINPLILVRGLVQRSPTWIAFGLLGQLLIFATSGLKSVALSGVAVLGFYWLLQRKDIRGWAIGFGVLVVSVFSVGMDMLRGTSFWSSLFVRRFLITPGLLAAAYVYTFDQTEKTRWAYSFMSGIFDYPYSETPSYLVGRTYFGQPGMNANANFIADGYANLGFAGVIIEALFIAILLILIDATSKGLPNSVATIMFIVPAIAFANSSAFTTATTHGVFFGIALAALVPRTGWRSPRGLARQAD